jgi:hypothetical protein
MSRTQLSETSLTWARTHNDLADTFRLWGVENYDVKSKAYGPLADRRNLPADERQVVVRFQHPDGREIVLVKSDWERPVDNFRQLYHGLEAMRVIWNKNLEDVVRVAYMQLSAPATQRDPYEVLGVRPDVVIEDAEAMYVIKAKRAHPDKGGSDEAMKELNDAIERVRADRLAVA